MSFVRSLDRKIVDALNRLSSEEGSWWRTLVEDPKVFIAVRKNELNAYFGGASLGKIAWRRGAPSFRVHVEYLVLADRDRKDGMYFDFLQESEPPRAVTIKNTQEYVKHFPKVKALAKEVAGSRERAGVNEIATRNRCVLDIEAAFNTLSEPKESAINPEPVGGRIDLVAVDSQCQLIFTEAKLFENDDLRLEPRPVCSQLISYHRWLKKSKEEIRQAYTCLIAKCPLQGKFFTRWDSLREKALTLDSIPRLLIFGYGKRDKRDVEDIRDRIVKEVSLLIPGFGPQHIRYQERATQVHASDIL